MRPCGLLLLAILVLNPRPASSATPEQSESLRDRIVYGLQLSYGLENAIPRNISHINILYGQPQIGIVVWHPSRAPLERFEFLSEGIIGASLHPGGHVAGDTLLFRFIGKPVFGLKPVLDLASGPLHTTINNHAPELGGHVQFLSQGGLGIQRTFSKRGSYIVEWRYFHMSNARLTKPNHGFNGNIVSVGMSWRRYQ